ncbi:Wadjet anti-phage system protein JetD domain-containing protein [Clostridium sp. LP20]|uniref:Wadjet anti-phage system protein JetD domain-containing protein n=1 Tax=Clostridium sp. LP20 TaxID=3418665 RepID=UPI003EE71077
MKIENGEIRSKMMSFKRKSIWKLDELFSLSSEILDIEINDIKNKYYEEFYMLITDMERTNVLKKVGNEQNSMQPRLYKKYRLVKETDNLTDEEKIKLIALNKLNITYYKKRASEFREDYGILVVLNNYMRNKTEYKDLSMNEISYELFGYEKAMTTGEQGRASEVMGKIGLNEESLGCRTKYNPLLNTIFKGFYQKEIRNIIVIENLETYWTLNRFLRENDTSIDMLVFGEGYSIVKNFAGIIQYGVTTKDNILYYGDIDLEGICIYSLLKNKFDKFTIKPNVKLYRGLLKSGKDKGVKESISPNQTIPAKDDMADFLSYFGKEEKIELEDILKNRLYIPQESLNYKRLRGDKVE